MSYFWHLNPFELQERPISDVTKLMRMTNMICRERQAQYGRR